VSPGDYETLDPALDLLADCGPDLSNGFTSHAPMVVEALCALGRPEAVMPWLERYRPGLLPRPAPQAPIEAAAWRAALGDEARSADWMALLQGELADTPWREVVARWLARLAPGACAAATHGLIRVAHAVRSLALRETPQRRRELGDALGAWASTYQTLPTPAARGSGRRSPAEALATLPLQPVAERRFRGSIVSALEGLDGFAPFEPVIDWIDPETQGLSALTQAFARVYWSNAKDPLTSIVFVHGVTSAAALRSLVAELEPHTAREVLRYGWQAGAALYASVGTEPPFTGELPAGDLAAEVLITAAIAHGDDHVIKFSEACLREYALLPDPVFLHAARHALGALPRTCR
jgi:hypothetical protein